MKGGRFQQNPITQILAPKTHEVFRFFFICFQWVDIDLSFRKRGINPNDSPTKKPLFTSMDSTTKIAAWQAHRGPTGWRFFRSPEDDPKWNGCVKASVSDVMVCLQNQGPPEILGWSHLKINIKLVFRCFLGPCMLKHCHISTRFLTFFSRFQAWTGNRLSCKSLKTLASICFGQRWGKNWKNNIRMQSQSTTLWAVCPVSCNILAHPSHATLSRKERLLSERAGRVFKSWTKGAV